MKTDLEVIGTGFGRTGTDSMREALNTLGFGPCHHMRNLIVDKDHREDWRRFNAGEGGVWDTLLAGSKSCVDWPTAHYWPELIDMFPKAKVLLTWRSADSWWNSFSRTILPIIEQTMKKPSIPPGSQLIAESVFGGHSLSREHCIATYEANVERVKTTVPADRLLIFKIGDGWAPLCAHLGADIPDTPFPHVNSSSDFNTKGDLK